MFKKKFYFVVLSTLLLTLLLGLCGICYADNHHTFTVSDIKNICYNKWITIDSNTDTGINNYFDNHASDLTTLVTNLNSYNFVCVGFDGHSFNFLYTNNTSKPYIYSGKITGWGTNTSSYRCVLDIRYNIFRFDNPSNNSTETTYNSNYFYVGNTVYTNASKTTVRYNGGTYLPSSLFDGNFTEDKWEFTPNGTIVTINGAQWPYRYLDASYNLHLGSLVDAEHLHTIKVRFATYNQSLGTFAPYSDSRWQTIYDYDRDGRLQNKYPGAVTNNNGVLTLDWSMDLHNQQNNLMQLTFISDIPNQWPNLTQDYYLGNTYTYVSSGVVYPSLTFSGDYGNDYNQQQQDNIIQENHDETIDTITDDSEVDSMLGDFFNSGDLLNDIGYSPLENPFTSVILDLAQEFQDALLGTGNETLTIGWQGYSTTLHSEDFILPQSPLTTFIHLLCNGFLIFSIYKYGFELFQWINTGRLNNLLNEANQKQYYWF